ncbi:MAG: HD domain-containing protein [Pseudomonadota bacterium]
MIENEILEIFPEFKLIADENIQKRSINAQKIAIEMGAWRLAQLFDIPFTLLIPDCKISYVDHVKAVFETAKKIAETMETVYEEKPLINYNFLYSGALLHDVGKLLEYKKEGTEIIKSKNGQNLRHPISGVGIAYLAGLPDEVAHCIAYHSHEGDNMNRSKEAIIINHADFVNFEVLKQR